MKNTENNKENVGHDEQGYVCLRWKPLFKEGRTLFNPLKVNLTKWSNTLKQFVDELFKCLSVFDNFVGWHLKD